MMDNLVTLGFLALVVAVPVHIVVRSPTSATVISALAAGYVYQVWAVINDGYVDAFGALTFMFATVFGFPVAVLVGVAVRWIRRHVRGTNA